MLMARIAGPTADPRARRLLTTISTSTTPAMRRARVIDFDVRKLAAYRLLLDMDEAREAGPGELQPRDRRRVPDLNELDFDSSY
jgi:hypothetical protein